MIDYNVAMDWHAKMWRFMTPEAAHSWAAPYMDGADAQMRRDLDNMAHAMVWSIRAASPFFCSKEILSIIESVTPTVPLNWAPDRSMLPVDDGFVWFEEPSTLIQQESKHPISALSWTVFNRDQQSNRNRQGVDFFMWGRSSNTYALYPYQAQMWRFDEAIDLLVNDGHTATLDGREPEIGNATHALRLQFFASFLTFINETITTRRVVEPSRAARRRFQSQTRQDDVQPIQVIELRRRQYETVEREGESEHRDYSCQWVVRGHWRNQWYPSQGRHQPKWITPYVKGPEDKPLKTPRANVFAVVR